MNEVTVLKEGYAYVTAAGDWKADGSISLIKSDHSTVLFDTGLPIDKEFIVTALRDRGLCTSDMTHVICSHGHSDHVGNLGLFPDALLIVSYDICRRDTFFDNGLAKGQRYFIDEGVDVIATPGHTSADVCLVVQNTTKGTILVAGDLFENESDIEDPSVWQAVSQYHQLQATSRYNAVSQFSVRFVIPGHGAMFQLTEDHMTLLKNQSLSSVT